MTTTTTTKNESMNQVKNILNTRIGWEEIQQKCKRYGFEIEPEQDEKGEETLRLRYKGYGDELDDIFNLSVTTYSCLDEKRTCTVWEFECAMLWITDNQEEDEVEAQLAKAFCDCFRFATEEECRDEALEYYDNYLTDITRLSGCFRDREAA